MAGGVDVAKKIPLVSTVLGAVSVRRWVAELRRWGIGRLTRGYDAEANSLKVLMKETGFRKWAKFWHYGRTQISLQMRLFAEQVYSDKGFPWSELVTGFGPLTEVVMDPEVRAREIRARSTAIQKSKRKKALAELARRRG